MLKKAIIDVQLKNLFIQKLAIVPPSIRKQTYKRLQLFRQDPLDAQLRNHALRGRYLGFRSIDITSDHRALFKEFGNKVFFHLLGTHKELYGEDKIGS